MRFVKMHGLGNDFIMVDSLTDDQLDAMSGWIRKMCCRRTGIGADGLIAVLPPRSEGADFRMRIINADGSEAEMCGNGIRCFAVFVSRIGRTDKRELAIDTGAGLIRTDTSDEQVRVDMGKPILDASAIPTTRKLGRVINDTITVEGKTLPITAVSMGNPHAVIHVDQITDAHIDHLGPLLETHPFFPNRTNVEFVQVLSEDEIRMRVWERGCGETEACGTGACASVVAGILTQKHGNDVTVHLNGGDLQIEWDGDPHHSVFMTGPATWVFEGEIAES
jgi:diaminopimelate epimerase